MESLEQQSEILYAATHLDKINKKGVDAFPLSYVFSRQVRKTRVPRMPLVFNRGKTFIDLVLPFFKPKISKLILLEYPYKKNVEFVQLYGKI